jgi:integrase
LTGGIAQEAQADGTLAFRLRFTAHGARQTVVLHERRSCECGCGGGWTERTARVELRDIIAAVTVGVWECPARSVPTSGKPMPTFHEYASYWLAAKVEGVLGGKPLDDSTSRDYRWRISHLLVFFGPYRLDQVDGELCLGFKMHKLKESRELTQALAAGADLRDERGRKLKPIGPSSLKKFLDTLASILEEAVEDGFMPANPARSRRLNVSVPKPKRTFLERDELVAIEDAAQEQDPSLAVYVEAYRNAPSDSTQAAVARALSRGRRPTQITRELGLPKTTVGYHCARIDRLAGNYVGRRAIVHTLGRSGVRVSELCDIKIGHLTLNGLEGSRLQVSDAKTDAGIRAVEMTNQHTEVINDHIDRFARAGFDIGPSAPLFPNSRGERICRQRVGELLNEAAELADQRLQARGFRPLPNVTPHTLRRTYISIALLANNFDIKWVMSQVGHADSTMTLDIYAQLQQRVNRRHGNEIDRLMQEARTHLYRDGGGDANQAEESNPAVVLDDVSDGASKKRRTATPEQAPQTAPL